MPTAAAAHVGGLRVVHVEHAVALGRPPRAGAARPAKVAQRRGAPPPPATPTASAAAAAAIAFSRLCGAAQADLAPASSGSRAESPKSTRGRRRARRGLERRAAATATCVGAPGSRRSAAWRRGRPRGCRGGRGGPRSRFSSTAHVGRELDRVLELEARALADDGGVGVELADQRRQRRADVAGHRDRQLGRAVDRAEQLGRGRLAVRAGHRDEAVRQQPPGQLELADHRRCRACARGLRSPAPPWARPGS